MQVLRRQIVNVFPMTGNDIYSAGGIALIRFGQVPGGLYVEVERLAIDAGSGTTFNLFATALGSLNLREHTAIGADSRAIADENSPVRFYPGEDVLARFTGGTQGDIATCYGQAWLVAYLPHEIGAGGEDGSQPVATGIHTGIEGTTPDPGGWN